MQNKAAIMRIFMANTVSGAAQGVSMLAIPWYFTDNLKDSSQFGKIYGLVTLVSLFWGLYAGTLVDRYNRKHLFLWENAVCGLLFIGIASMGYILGQVPTIWVAVAFAATFFNYNLHYPALHAFMQEINAPKDYAHITSYLEIQGQMTTALSGGLAAVLLSGISAGDINLPLLGKFYWPYEVKMWALHDVFMLDGLTYLLSLVLIFPIQYKPIATRIVEKLSLSERFQIGIDFLKANKLIFIFGNASYFIFVVTMVINYTLLPAFARNHLGGNSSVFAIGDISWAIGSAFAGAFIRRIFNQTQTIKGNIGLACLTTTGLCVLALSRHIGLFYGIMFLLGWANAGARVLRVSYLFHHIPNQVIGRTSAVFQVINVLLRLGFIWVCSLPFFQVNISYSFGALAVGCLLSIGLMVAYYPALSKLKNMSDS